MVHHLKHFLEISLCAELIFAHNPTTLCANPKFSIDLNMDFYN